MTDNPWREAKLTVAEEAVADPIDTGVGMARQAASTSMHAWLRRPQIPGPIASGFDGDPSVAYGVETSDSIASIARCLLLAATRGLIIAQLDPRAVEHYVTARLGASHRRVTILLRTLLCEMALHAGRRIAIGSFCRPHPTEDEVLLIGIVEEASAGRIARAHAQAAILLGGGATDRVVPLAAALGEAMQDAGLPIRGTGTTQPAHWLN